MRGRTSKFHMDLMTRVITLIPPSDHNSETTSNRFKALPDAPTKEYMKIRSKAHSVYTNVMVQIQAVILLIQNWFDVAPINLLCFLVVKGMIQIVRV